MVSLTQRKQLGLKIEDVEGTPETITSSELVTVLNPSFEINLNNIRRPVLRGTFSKLTSITGVQEATVTYEQEFAGPVGSDPATAPTAPVGASLRMCGFRQFNVYAVEISSFAGGRVVVGDVLVSDTTASTIRVAATLSKAQFDDGGGAKNTHYDILFFEPLTGAINATDTALTALNPNLTVGVSHSGATPVIGLSSQTPDHVGDGWVPTSSQTQTITVSSVSGTFTVGEIIFQPIDTATISGALDVAYGVVVATDNSTYIEFRPLQGSGFNFTTTATPPGQVQGADSGATADVDANAVSTQSPSATLRMFEDGIAKRAAGARGSCTMTFPTGEFPLLQVSAQGAYNNVLDLSNLSVGGATQAAVPAFFGTEFRIDRNWLPCQSSITIDVGQNLVRRTCSNNASGLEGFIITDRTPTMTMDPEAVAEAIASAYTDAKAGTAFPIQLRWGRFSSGTGIDAWLFSADQVQYEALNAGDRDGIITHEATMQLNSYSTVDEAEFSIINYSRTLVEAL